MENHHNENSVDTIEFKILWDADNLVNLRDSLVDKSEQEIRDIISNTFFTDEAKKIILE